MLLTLLRQSWAEGHWKWCNQAAYRGLCLFCV